MGIKEIDEKTLGLLRKVYFLTINHKVDWQATANEDIFTAEIKSKYSLQLRKSDRTFFFILLDSDGEIISSLSNSCYDIVNMGEGRESMRVSELIIELYKIARVKARKISEKLSEATDLLDL